MLKSDVKSVAIGCFDGMHLGHFELFGRLGENGALLIIDKNRKIHLTPNEKKSEISGLPCFFYKFDEIQNLSGDEFVGQICKEFVNLAKIVVGQDFKFGKNAAWNACDLKSLFSGKTEIVNEFCINNIPVHTSVIKKFLQNGEISAANELLGRRYRIIGHCVKGAGIGKKLLFATINLDTGQYFLPKNGVYVTFAKIGEKCYKSVTFIGNRASIDDKFSVEVHLIDKNIQILLEFVEIYFIKYLREVVRFDEISELKEQISADINIARKILENQNER